MQRRLITVILFALVAAIGSSTILYRIIRASSAHASDASMQEIYVASRDLTAGTVIGASDIHKVKWPGAVNSLWIQQREDLIGRGLIAAINNGEPIPDNRLAAKGAGAGFESAIPQGMRVVPVRVDEQGGLAHVIAPGMHVDVLSTESAGGLGPNAVTRTILQNLKVFSIEQPTEKNGKDKSPWAQSVNLVVTPEQAEVLSQAIAQNRIQLVLRNPLDEGNISDAIVHAMTPPAAMTHLPRLAALLTEHTEKPAEKKPEAVPEAPKPAPPTVEILQGTKRTVTVVAPGTSQEASK